VKLSSDDEEGEAGSEGESSSEEEVVQKKKVVPKKKPAPKKKAAARVGLLQGSFSGREDLRVRPTTGDQKENVQALQQVQEQATASHGTDSSLSVAFGSSTTEDVDNSGQVSERHLIGTSMPDARPQQWSGQQQLSLPVSSLPVLAVPTSVASVEVLRGDLVVLSTGACRPSYKNDDEEGVILTYSEDVAIQSAGGLGGLELRAGDLLVLVCSLYPWEAWWRSTFPQLLSDVIKAGAFMEVVCGRTSDPISVTTGVIGEVLPSPESRRAVRIVHTETDCATRALDYSLVLVCARYDYREQIKERVDPNSFGNVDAAALNPLGQQIRKLAELGAHKAVLGASAVGVEEYLKLLPEKEVLAVLSTQATVADIKAFVQKLERWENKDVAKSEGKGRSLSYWSVVLREDGPTVSEFLACANAKRKTGRKPGGTLNVLARLESAVKAGRGGAPVVLCNSGESGNGLRPWDHFLLSSRGDKLFMWMIDVFNHTEKGLLQPASVQCDVYVGVKSSKHEDRFIAEAVGGIILHTLASAPAAYDFQFGPSPPGAVHFVETQAQSGGKNYGDPLRLASGLSSGPFGTKELQLLLRDHSRAVEYLINELGAKRQIGREAALSLTAKKAYSALCCANANLCPHCLLDGGVDNPSCPGGALHNKPGYFGGTSTQFTHVWLFV